MRYRIFLIIMPVMALSVSVFARPLADSIGVENLNGKKVIIHKVEPKETYYAIGRRYNVDPNTVLNFNNRVPLQPGATVKVPTDLPFIDPVKKQVDAGNTNMAGVQDYKVSQGETLYAISRRFNTSIDDIMSLNGLTSNNLAAGQIIKVRAGGAPATATQVNKPADVKPVTPAPVYKTPVSTPVITEQPAKPIVTVPGQTLQDYKVGPGETLYSIAKRFGTTVEDIKSINNLSGDNLTPGEILHVHSGAPLTQQQSPAPVSAYKPEYTLAKRDTIRVVNPDSTATGAKNPTNRYGLNEKNEKGVATWLDDDTGLDPNKKLVLHRTAPIGTVIKITNPMSNRSAFAKVVGRFNDNESTKDVIIVMTKNVAESLGALDKRFHVVITYGVPNE